MHAACPQRSTLVEVRRAVLFLTLVGCNQVYGLDPTTARDALDLEPPPCSSVQFGAPLELSQFSANDDGEFDPQLSADGRELWFVSNQGVATMNRYLLFRGVRTSTAEPFAVTLVDLLGQNPVQVGDPALTADGLRMMFVRDGSPRLLYEGVRETPDQFPFPEIVAVNGFSQFPFGVQAFDLTWDGHRIYFVVPETIGGVEEGVVWFGSRANRDAPFGNFQRLFEGANFPTISGDELEMFHVSYVNPDKRLFRRARTDRDAMFGPPVLVLDEGGDPDIAPTSNTMLVARNRSIAILERRCD